MDNNTAISLSKISKKYRIYNKPQDRLKEALLRTVLRRKKRYCRDFWPLKNISLEIPKGTTFGIIGQNGSGKSTLLQIIANILQPTTGTINVNGRISALLELGAGFNKDFTGRENVFMQGAIMGIGRRKMAKRFDEIAEFADIGEFMDQPVKIYSSGMYLRLAFATAINVSPEILIVDEILAVGDFRFRQKCSEKINEIQKNATVLLVSHNMRDILMLCQRAIVLDKGKTVFHGTSDEAVDFYLEMMNAEEEKKAAHKNTNYASKTLNGTESTIYGDIYHNKEKITDIYYRWVDEFGNTAKTVEYGSSLAFEFSFKILKPVTNLVIGVPVWDSNGNKVTAFGTDMKKISIKIKNNGTVAGRLKMDKLIFNPGKYSSFFAVVDNKEYLYRNPIGTLTIKGLSVCFGMITPEHNWHFD